MISLPIERTTPTSPSVPETMVQAPKPPHSPMSQYLPTRAHTRSTGALTSTIMWTDV